MISRRGFLVGAGLTASTRGPFRAPQEAATHTGRSDSKASPGGRPVPLTLDRVQVRGWLGERVDRARAGMDNLSENTWWNVAGQWGYTLPAIWLRNSLLIARYTGEYHPLIEETKDRLVGIATKPEYRIDYHKTPIAGYLDAEVVTGLLAYYDTFKDPAALNAAAAKGRYIVDNHRNTSHYYKAIAIERLLRLSEQTGDSAFRKTAVAIAEETRLDFLETKVGVHGAAASMIFDFYLCLYEALGDERYLRWALAGWQQIRDRMSATGGIGETLHFTRPPGDSDLHTETCQTSWWMMFNLHLARLTGRPVYWDLAERVLLNELLSQQLHRAEGAGFCALSDIDQGFRGDHNYFCCDCEGTFGLLNAIENIFTVDEDAKALDVNLFVDSAAKFHFSGHGWFAVEQKSDYPETGLAIFRFSTEKPAEVTLRLRVPERASVARVVIGGRVIEPEIRDSVLTVKGAWKNHDTLEISFALPMSVEVDNSGFKPRVGSVRVNDQAGRGKRIAVLHGPLVSAIFRTGHNNDVSWVWNADYPEVLESGGSVFEGYPGSAADSLEIGGETFETNSVPEMTEAGSTNRVPFLRWTSRLGLRVTIERQVRVLPGLPVCLEYTDTIRGWDGSGRLLVGGLRFATAKTNLNPSYRARPTAWPYPFPVFASKPDLSNCDDIVYQAGTFGMYETLADGKELPKTGTFMLNNGFFSAVALYDPNPVARLICRRTAQWVGIFFEPKLGPEIRLTRRCSFPLNHKPASQSTMRSRAERASRVRAQWKRGTGGSIELVLSGPCQPGARIKVPHHPEVGAGTVMRGERSAGFLFDCDEGYFLAQLDVPGTYQAGV